MAEEEIDNGRPPDGSLENVDEELQNLGEETFLDKIYNKIYYYVLTVYNSISHNVLISLIVVLVAIFVAVLLYNVSGSPNSDNQLMMEMFNKSLYQCQQQQAIMAKQFNDTLHQFGKELVNELKESLNQYQVNVKQLSNSLHHINDQIGKLNHYQLSHLSILKDLREQMKLIQGYNSYSTSCKEIKKKQPNSPSGVYLLVTRKGDTKYVYCNMGELCGSGGGWTRLAYLDMSDATENCPSGFRLYQSGGVRACGRPTSSGGSCASITFPSNGISYSQVCGRVVGYQYGPTEALYGSRNDGLDSYYVNGVSITRGSPRKHVWTLIAGRSEVSNSWLACPCNTGSTRPILSYIGNHYYCESGNNEDPYATIGKLYTSDPLWDGLNCTDKETPCCKSPSLPWFHRDFGKIATSDYLELRVCGDKKTDDEDVPISLYELYVK